MTTIVPAAPLRRVRRARSRGFSLAELMAVVAIMAILAAIAFASFQHRAFGANLTQATAVLRSIGVAEEQYRSLNQVYLDVSSSPGNAGAGWYPVAAVPWSDKVAFVNTTHADYAPVGRRGWRHLNPIVLQPVGFTFKVNAGLPTTPVTSVVLATSSLTLSATAGTEPWYVVQARAEPRPWSGSAFCTVVAASFTPEVLSVRDQCY